MYNKAVDGVSFTIYKGEVFSLVGESGCGKTTTGRTIIKLYNSSGGEAFFHGTRIVSDVKAAKKTHKENMAVAKAARDEEKEKLKLSLEKQVINKELYMEKLAEVDEQFNTAKNASLEVYRLAKKDKKFEKNVSEHATDAKKNLEKFPEYNEINEKYDALNVSLTDEYEVFKKDVDRSQQALSSMSKTDKDAYQAAKEKHQLLVEKANNASKELKLNKIRRKQDLSNLQYGIVHENKLLMRKMQMIFQDPIASLNPRMTVKEIIAEGLRINGFKNEKVIDDKVKEALKTVGLVPEHASRYPHEFSGGQRQRIGIARALVVEPSFIIADEPISALDVSIRAQVINLLNDLREEKGITIMFIAHDLSVVKYFSDRLAVMYFGKIVEIGNKDKIFDNPMHPYTLSLMRSIPQPDPLFEQQRGKTERYNPQAEHDYSKEGPELREIEPDHFVLCNTEEYKKYKKQAGK
ncbi:MAG: ATP-binding cassette domain-containing protein [Acholeplasmataceae bacterium]|nr:ATP-binding cassette domain-containing protein [Acholeplasmataceae bacterium]